MNHENTIETINRFASRLNSDITTTRIGLIADKENNCLNYTDNKIILSPCPVLRNENFLFKTKGSEIYDVNETRCLVEEKGAFRFPFIDEYNSGFAKNCTSFNTLKLETIKKPNGNIIAML